MAIEPKVPQISTLISIATSEADPSFAHVGSKKKSNSAPDEAKGDDGIGRKGPEE